MGTNKLPVFLKEFVEWGGQKFDDAFFKKGFGDVVDKLAFKGVLNIVNGQISDDVPDEIKPELHEAQTLIIAGDYDDGGAKAVSAMIDLIQLSNIKDKTKKVLVTSLSFVESILEGID